MPEVVTQCDCGQLPALPPVTDATELGTARGDCPACGLNVRLTTDGRVRWHRRLVHDASPANRIPPGACEGTGQGPARAGAPPRRVWANVDAQGTAVSESALCGVCRSEAEASGYSAAEMVDCTGNEALSCQLCGWDGETDHAQRAGGDLCGRHGGPWGDDPTCADCTDLDGNARGAYDGPACILTGAPGEDPEDCTTHAHERKSR